MKIIALVGSSGTGKSYKAILVAKERNIEHIIDDGLLINGAKVIAGQSAKREGTTVAAVKRALFLNENHRHQVIEAIEKSQPDSLLVLGTSDRMVKKIVEALELPAISETIYIEDISNEEERALAKNYRHKEGKHVIPVPTFEIKKDFSGYFIDTLKIFRKKDTTKEQVYEKTVVRPTFSYLGRYTISHRVIRQLIQVAAGRIDNLYKVGNIYIDTKPEGLRVTVDITMVYGIPIVPIIEAFQAQIIQEIEGMTSLNMLSVDIVVKKMIKI